MSRATVRDNSNAFSLFPFLAVLLCTMGALLVVLVAVTRLSRDQARREIARQRTTAAAQPAPVDDRRAQLAHVEQYIARLQQVQEKAEHQLHEDQLRLRDLEEHMRRLQDQARSLGAAAAELDALNEQHRDDREQARREADRLKKLIADTRESIDELKQETASQPRSYAIVPYKGPNGTYRPPIYIECRKNAVILQPEGIRLTQEDFRSPLGPGNPLAAALRAARAHYARQHPDAEVGFEHDPYPLILVRPEGISAYYIVRKAIENWDSNFGYEMVGGDWNLKFPPPDPELATAESHAIELARLRMQMLAEAAPRAYGTVDDRGRGVFPSSARGVGHFEFDDEADRYGDGQSGGLGLAGDGSGSGTGGDSFGGLEGEGLAGGTAGGGGHGSAAPYGGDAAGGIGATGGSELAGNDYGLTASGGSPAGTATGPGGLADGAGDGPGGGQPGGSGDREAGGPATGPQALAAADSATGANAIDSGEAGPAGTTGGSASGAPGGSTNQLAGDAATGGAAAAGGAAGGAGAASGAAGGSPCTGGTCSSPGGSSQGDSNTLSMSTVAETPSHSRSADSSSLALDPSRGRPNSVPIRRPIHLVVRSDRVAILPERSTTSASLTGGTEIELDGATEASLDRLIAALRDHVQQWGIAGNGLFWRPVVVLDVGPDGRQRAAELVRLLKRRGIELRYATTAQRDSETDPHATR